MRAPMPLPAERARAHLRKNRTAAKTTCEKKTIKYHAHSKTHHVFLEELADVLAAPLLSQAAHEQRSILIGRENP